MTYKDTDFRQANAEMSILGAILLDNRVLDDLTIQLEPRDFTIQSHQTLYTVMKHMHESDRPIDLVTLTDRLNTYGKLDQSGGVAYMTELASVVPTVQNARHYAEIVHRHAVQRRIMELGDRIKSIATEGEFSEEEDMLQAIERLSDSIRPEGNGELVSITDARQEYFDYLARKDDLIHTGFPKFDEWMGGLGRGWLYILAARPSVGKTAKMLQMIQGIATQGKGQCLVWSQEMKRPQLFNRMLSSLTGVSANRIRLKHLSEGDMKHLREGYDALEMLPISIADAKNVTIDEIRAVARQQKRKHGRIGAIFVDYLGIMNIPTKKGETRAQAVGEVTKAAKHLAIEIDCPVILLCQMSREGKKAIKPSLEHLRESGSIEQDADLVEFLWEDPEDTDPGRDHMGAKVIQSVIAKGRDIGVNEFRYAFKGWIQRFDEL
ncbi:DnaB-like helicase C-terminal domain-containing protein [Thermoactinomyces sp. DSM 45892]|uniref:replicative DNA helicase n=1 Tax=Thermoactinomyces sp. DSM 45892 TaxID=1882753 RepID=UPI0008983BBC|nr:DnaB-like helicase C-terminal domain-containing protein [Thermoactinomyces sp. DSM 45892]SDY71121.1 replicative DNA helicase [Thermoactinomyces sp. DSM 45892]